MAKVILITSRADVTSNSTAFQIQNFNPIATTTAGNLKADSYLAPFFAVFPTLLGMDANKFLDLAKQNAEDASKLEKVIKENITLKLKNKGETDFQFGIYKKKPLSNSDISVYFANEFPPFASVVAQDKFFFLNAILSDICKYEGLQSSSDIEWEIVSHDLDWGEKSHSNCYLNDSRATEEVKQYFNGIKHIVDKSKYPTLYSIINADSTRIQLFQHDANVDDGYLYVKRMISDTNYLEDFTTFLNGTKDNHEFFQKVINAADADKENAIKEFINKVNPDYGIFPYV